MHELDRPLLRICNIGLVLVQATSHNDIPLSSPYVWLPAKELVLVGICLLDGSS